MHIVLHGSRTVNPTLIGTMVTLKMARVGTPRHSYSGGFGCGSREINLTKPFFCWRACTRKYTSGVARIA